MSKARCFAVFLQLANTADRKRCSETNLSATLTLHQLRLLSIL